SIGGNRSTGAVAKRFDLGCQGIRRHQRFPSGLRFAGRQLLETGQLRPTVWAVRLAESAPCSVAIGSHWKLGIADRYSGHTLYASFLPILKQLSGTRSPMSNWT